MVQPEQPSGHETFTLSLFPLNTVLFPGMPLPLHIFEERYKAMINQCQEAEEPFGIVLIKDGLEVGEPAEPFQVGTTARIMQLERLEEGRMNILTQGERRFTTTEIIQRTPHVVGRVVYLDEEPGEDLAGVVEEISEKFRTFLRNVTALSGGWTAQASVPQDPVQLAYGVAGNLNLPQRERQSLLELPTAKARLDQLVPLLDDGNERLLEEVTKRSPYKGARLN